MTPADAASEYWDTLDAVTEHKPVAARHEKAVSVLKKHMADAGLKTFRGIDLVEGDGGSRLNEKLLQAKFGSGIDDCRVPTVRRSLIPKRRPRKRKPANA